MGIVWNPLCCSDAATCVRLLTTSVELGPRLKSWGTHQCRRRVDMCHIQCTEHGERHVAHNSAHARADGPDQGTARTTLTYALVWRSRTACYTAPRTSKATAASTSACAAKSARFALMLAAVPPHRSRHIL